MNLQDIGKFFVIGLSSFKMSKEEAKLIKLLSPQGVVIFARNVNKESKNWQQDLRALISAAREECGHDNLIVSIDHEGGLVNRLPEPITHFPAAKNWGKDTENIATTMAKDLKSLDIDCSYAPVLDIHTEEKNKVIGDRAFACEPSDVSSHAITFFKTLEKNGILACGKHFPGHGSTIEDSHYELPISNLEITQLEQCELIPFKDAISEKIPMIMTAHVYYPKIDKEFPATLSKKILLDILREQLKFAGTIISDDLEMNALAKYSKNERALYPFNAGVNLLLECSPKLERPVEDALIMAEGLKEAFDARSIKKEIFTSSKSKIEQLCDYRNSIRV